ncbi:MAG TPA: Ig-like domain-containing protein [Longimicrobium sp.]|nr:Ig-like domain-containing protein [Longimicrobium sp.]
MRIDSFRRRWRAPVAACLLLAAACDKPGGGTEPEPEPVPAELVAIEETANQAAPVGTPVTWPPAVLVFDAAGEPVPGVAVTFAVVQGGGTLGVTSAVTNAFGLAHAGSWILGTTAGVNTARATVQGLPPVSFHGWGEAGGPATIVKLSGDGQIGTAGTALPAPLMLMLADVHGNGVTAAVTLTLTMGGTQVAQHVAVSNDQGVAAAQFMLPTTTGALTVAATVANLPPVFFTLTVGPRAPEALVKAAGDNQEGAAGAALADSLTIRTRDLFGNAVPGIPVTFTVTQGGGSVSALTVSTSAQGLAKVRFTLGPSAGTHTVNASSPGLPNTVFTATAQAGAPAALARHAGHAQMALAGTPVPIAPAVRVTDAHDNPVPGVGVTFSVTGGGGSVTGANATTNASGVATLGGEWTLGPPGVQTLAATVPGLDPVTFLANATDPCAVVTDLQVDVEAIGSLAAADCRLASGHYVDTYRLVLGQQRHLELAYTAFHPLQGSVELRSATRSIDLLTAPFAGAGAHGRFILPAGTYYLSASATAPWETGFYSLDAVNFTTGVNCSPTTDVVVPGVVVADQIDPGQCVSPMVRAGPGNQIEAYYVEVMAGQTLTVTLASSAFDPWLAVVDAGGTVVQDDNGGGGTTARVSVTSPTRQWYRVEAVARENAYGAYTLTVDASGGSSLRARRPDARSRAELADALRQRQRTRQPSTIPARLRPPRR